MPRTAILNFLYLHNLTLWSQVYPDCTPAIKNSKRAIDSIFFDLLPIAGSETMTYFQRVISQFLLLMTSGDLNIDLSENVWNAFECMCYYAVCTHSEQSNVLGRLSLLVYKWGAVTLPPPPGGGGGARCMEAPPKRGLTWISGAGHYVLHILLGTLMNIRRWTLCLGMPLLTFNAQKFMHSFMHI